MSLFQAKMPVGSECLGKSLSRENSFWERAAASLWEIPWSKLVFRAMPLPVREHKALPSVIPVGLPGDFEGEFSEWSQGEHGGDISTAFPGCWKRDTGKKMG